MIGRVVLWDESKNMGFIKNEGGSWFVHKSDVTGPIYRGMEVDFLLADGRRDDLVAVDVKEHVFRESE